MMECEPNDSLDSSHDYGLDGRDLWIRRLEKLCQSTEDDEHLLGRILSSTEATARALAAANDSAAGMRPVAGLGEQIPGAP